MGLNAAKGEMYRDWVTHVHSHLSGACPHRCSYCLVQAMGKRFKRVGEIYSGEVRLREKELQVRYGSGKTIFVEHMNDLFAEQIPPAWITQILGHCNQWPYNTYVFQTKNPARMLPVRDYALFPPKRILGTTIESDDHHECMGAAPPTWDRAAGIRKIRKVGERVFVTIEPVLAMNVGTMLAWMDGIRPEFVNIGADSKGTNLPEPTPKEVRALIDGLVELGIQVKMKRNLQRLLPT